MNGTFSVEILAIGTELLLGDIANTDAQFVSRELAALGIPVYSHTVVGDNRVRLKAALEHAFTKNDMVIAIGGLGPTEDDITKDIAAEYFNRKMVMDKPSMMAIERRFATVGLPENVHKNALVPEGSRIVPNDFGSAPGVWLEQDGKTLILLPGPPHELEPMFVNYAVPFLREKTGRVFVSRTLKFIGMGESKIETLLKDLFEAQTNPTLALYAKVWECHLRITASAPDEAVAHQLINPVADEIYTRLGDYIYGENEEELAEIVLDSLSKGNPRTLAIAESCTGGLVTAALVAVPGASAVLHEGLITYSNESKITRLGVDPALIKEHGAVSVSVAAAMAEGAARTSGADVGLSTTGISGPDGGTPEKPVGTVYIGLYIKGQETTTLALNLPGDRNQIRERAAMQALNFLRKALAAPKKAKYRNKDHEAFDKAGVGDLYETVGGYNIFMQCDAANPEAFRPLPEGYYFRLCRRDELETWKRVVTDEKHVPYLTTFYEKVYAAHENEFFRRCLFVCDANDKPVGSTFIWRSYKRINTVGWFRVLPGHEGKGLGRALLSEVLKNASFPIYLHTQPTSARAIKLYSDFGFKLITDAMPGNRPNDLEKSLPLLKSILPESDYANLQFTKAHDALFKAIQSREVAEF
jgi:nicotinamide-nucleotide amidase